MLCLRALLRVQRKLAPLTMALGLVTPAIAREPVEPAAIRHPVTAVTQLASGPQILSTVASVQGAKFSQLRPSVVTSVPTRVSAGHPPVALAKPGLSGLARNDSASTTVDATSTPAPSTTPDGTAAPAPSPSPAPAPAPQPENPNPNPTPPSPPPVPSLDIAAPATSATPAAPAANPAPQVPEVQPVAAGTQPAAAGVELPW